MLELATVLAATATPSPLRAPSARFSGMRSELGGAYQTVRRLNQCDAELTVDVAWQHAALHQLLEAREPAPITELPGGAIW